MRVWFGLYLKRFVISIPFILTLALIPLVMFALADISATQETSGIAVGLLSSGDNAVEKAQEEMTGGENGMVRFTQYDDVYTMEQDILRGDLRMGYRFDGDITERALEGSLKETITRMGSADDLFAPLVDGMVFSALYQALGTEVAADYIGSSALFPQDSKGQAAAYALEQNEAYRDVVDTVFVFHDVHGQQIEQQDAAMTFPARGICAALVLLCALLGVLNSRRDAGQGLYLRLSPQRQKQAVLYSALAPALLMTVVMLACIALAGSWGDALYEIAAGMLFVLQCTVFCALVSILVRGNGFVVLLPIIMMVTLVFTPVFFDLGAYVGLLRIVGAVSPVFWYLGAAAGNMTYLLGGLLYLGACLGLVLLVTRRRPVYVVV